MGVGLGISQLLGALISSSKNTMSTPRVVRSNGDRVTKKGLSTVPKRENGPVIGRIKNNGKKIPKKASDLCVCVLRPHLGREGQKQL